MFDDTDEYSSSSSDNSTTKDSRPRVFRKKKSSVFQRSLDEAKRCKHEIAVKKTLISNVDERRYAISSSGKVYEVSVSQIPSCTCPFRSKKPDQVCKHLVWVYLNVLRIGEQSNLIQQVGLTKSELKKMFQDAPASVPKIVLLPEGVDSTISQAFTRHSTDKMPQEWIITRKDHPKVAHCSGAPCFDRIEKGDRHLAVKGLYYPTNQAVAVSTTFRYCIHGGHA